LTLPQSDRLGHSFDANYQFLAKILKNLRALAQARTLR
jgi:hypothetical protein